MSLNLHLSDPHSTFRLWQTPTHITEAALENGVNTKQAYFDWIDATAERQKPDLRGPTGKVPTGIALEGRMLARDYRAYLDYKRQCDDHKLEVEAYLEAHVTARWSLT